MTLQPQCPHRRQRAAALLAVLWLVALLVMLVASTTKLLDQDMDAAIARRQVFRARMLAEAALAPATLATAQRSCRNPCTPSTRSLSRPCGLRSVSVTP